MISPLLGGRRPVVTVIQSSPDVPLDRFDSWLDGVEVRTVAAFAGESVPTPERVGAGLVVLGGHMSTYDDATAPWLPELRALLAAASEQGVPTLGICLGAQLLAAARGGRVQVDAPPGREAGIVDVHWRPEASGDAVVGAVVALGDARNNTPQPSMHADAVVDLPRGAVWLASSAMYPYQAFRIGSAWGVQFHPEVAASRLATWDEATLVADGFDRAALVARAEADASLTDEQARALVGAFADVVREARR